MVEEDNETDAFEDLNCEEGCIVEEELCTEEPDELRRSQPSTNGQI